jgi:hypothetical protein
MPVTPPRSLKIGTIIDKTLGVIEHSIPPVAIFVGVLTVINSGVAWFTLEMKGATDAVVIWFAGVAVGIVAGYLLLDAVVKRTGLRSRGEGDVFLTYVGMSLLFTLGFVAGLIALILPGLVVMARWSLAGPLVIARGEGATRALGESWELTRGGEFSILIAMLALVGPLIAVIATVSAIFAPGDPIGIVVGQLVTSLTSVVTIAMGVALYGLIVGAPQVASAAD